MSTSMDCVVIVGGGLAGASAAFALRDASFEGEITVVGDEEHLPYERPPLSKEYLRGEETADALLVRPAADYEGQGVETVRGRRAMTIDRPARTVELDDGQRLTYDALVLATGAAPRRLVATNAYLEGVHHLRTRDDADAIRTAAESASNVVVVGGGWVGSEVAASLREVGRPVTLVANLPRPLERVLGPEVGQVYADVHRAHGVELVTGRVRALAGERRVESVLLADGRTISADLVVAGVGAVPRGELALRAGLEVADGGIAVDDRLRTSDPSVWAIGDVAAAFHPRFGERVRVEHWDNARRQGRLVARNLMGADEAYDRIPYFYSDQFELKMEYRGRATTWDEVVIRGDPASGTFLAFWLRDGRVAAAMNVNAFDAGKTISAMVRTEAVLDAARLADPAIPIGELAA